MRLGCWLQRTDYPNVDVVMIPRRALAISFPLGQPTLPPGIVLPPGMVIPAAMATGEATGLAARATGVRFDLEDYDQRAPSITFRDPWTWELLPFPALLRASVPDEKSGRQLNVILDSHPDTKRPFLCLRGVREYHEHAQHTGDDWNLYRASTSLFSIMYRVWQVCIGSTRPHAILSPLANALEVRWESDVAQ